ncbi:MAG: hypothetical protein LUD22_00690 [Coprobacillus sp.]|nr:hypothetical protein [Coprobacillus sp.]
MSSSLGLIISMLFVAITFMFGGDLLTLQAAFTSLENAANDIAYFVAYYFDFSDEFVAYLEEMYTVKITSDTGIYGGAYGDMVDFYVTKTVDHLFIMGTEYTLTVERTAILGSYGLF